MAYRSWLKDVRKINDLGQHLGHFTKANQGGDREWEAEKKLHHLLETRILPVDDKSATYFDSGLHDGFVYGVEQIKNKVEITISNSLFEIFTQEFFPEVGDDRDPILSPVRLVFEGVNYANAFREDLEGWLKFDDWSKWRPMPEQGWGDDFTRGWFYEQEGKLQWIGQFHKWVEIKRKLKSEIYILIDCEKAYAVPESDETLRKKMGDECFETWSYFMSLPKGEQWHEHGYLRNYLKAKGIPIRHIPLQSER